MCVQGQKSPTERKKMDYKEYAADLLGVSVNEISSFCERDKFNNDNKLEGYICHRSDYRYGALVLVRVNDVEIFPYQKILVTPKLQYPFSKTKDGEPTRNYKWPNADHVEIYTKYDGTNIASYSYEADDHKRYVTFKTRLQPTLKKSKWGDFPELWKEMIQKYPEIKCPNQVLSGQMVFSYELFGKRNQHLVNYNEDLDTRLLFAVDQYSVKKIYPSSHFSRAFPRVVVHPVPIKYTFGQELTTIYNILREQAEEKNIVLENGTIDGTEGYVVYVKIKETGLWALYKAKPDSVEKIHWESDTIPAEVISATIINSLEDGIGFNLYYVKSLLFEEFSKDIIEKNNEHIEKIYNEIKQNYEFEESVFSKFEEINAKKGMEKSHVLREMSKFFTKKEMPLVFNALNKKGVFSNE